uniref:Uncharacterized protein n=1 Tax=Avena sativa TaxID=4498 RepID=A0ACD5U256_AVESA
MPMLSGARRGCSRRGGGGFLLPRQPVVVTDVGCNCSAARVLGSLYSSLTSRVRGGGSKSPHASSSSTATTAFTSSTAGTTTVSSVDDSWGTATYATNTNTLLFEDEAEARRQRRRRRSARRHRKRGGRGVGVVMARGEGEEEAAGVAVEVVSAAPYEDFRESMAAMVVEKEMYAWEDLNALLHGFLSLNSPRHHPLILHAFADLWAPRGGLFCPPSPCLGL